MLSFPRCDGCFNWRFHLPRKQRIFASAENPIVKGKDNPGASRCISCRDCCFRLEEHLVIYNTICIFDSFNNYLLLNSCENQNTNCNLFNILYNSLLFLVSAAFSPHNSTAPPAHRAGGAASCLQDFSALQIIALILGMSH